MRIEISKKNVIDNELTQTDQWRVKHIRIMQVRSGYLFNSNK